MKMTVEISASLLHEARKLAAREGVTLQTLIERGLDRVVAEAKSGVPFNLRRASFKGKGLQSHLRRASWEQVRDLASEGRGG